MCGIAGIATLSQLDRLGVPHLLDMFSASMAARGPDAEGTWISPSGGSAMVHRRLSILDVSSRANQPMRSADGRYVLVFNGEIYNYEELRGELERRGRVFATTGDTEVLLQMYIEHGTAMLNRLRGMYAFAIWDEVSRRLLLARDPFGIKPLYFALANGQFYFASQVQALRSLPGAGQSHEPEVSEQVR